MNADQTSEHQRAHARFSAECFNATWKILDQANRSLDDEVRMLSLAHASLWHWTQRTDCTKRNLSIGHWLLARVYAVLGQGEYATRHGRLCLVNAEGSEPFYTGYAHEALARAAVLQRDWAQATTELASGRACAALVTEDDDRKRLEADLQAIADAFLTSR